MVMLFAHLGCRGSDYSKSRCYRAIASIAVWKRRSPAGGIPAGGRCSEIVVEVAVSQPDVEYHSSPTATVEFGLRERQTLPSVRRVLIFRLPIRGVKTAHRLPSIQVHARFCDWYAGCSSAAARGPTRGPSLYGHPVGLACLAGGIACARHRCVWRIPHWLAPRAHSVLVKLRVTIVMRNRRHCVIAPLARSNIGRAPAGRP